MPILGVCFGCFGTIFVPLALGAAAPQRSWGIVLDAGFAL
jgi:hypothetical protein